MIIRDGTCSQVDDAGQIATVNQCLHAAASGSGGMEYNALNRAAQPFKDLGCGLSCDAKHGQADGGPVTHQRFWDFGHGGDCGGSLAKDDPADPVQPGKVGV